MVKIIWILIGLNSLTLIFFILWYLSETNGKHVDTMEKGWSIILLMLGLIVILLAALPLWFGHSRLSIGISAFFAVLPLAIYAGIFISNHMPSFSKKKTMAELYYKDKTQREIAAAIEKADTNLLKELIKGQDMSVQGTRVNDWDGLNYLQFAIKLRSDSIFSPFNDGMSKAVIRILVENGSPTTPALVDATSYLPQDMVKLLLDAGADPNVYSLYTGDRILFSLMGTSKEKNDIAILLLQHGADVNAKAYGNYGMTPIMFSANNARTSESWKDVWRVVRYLLEEKNADYLHVTKDGFSFAEIIRKTREESIEKQITMCPDFMAIVAWLKQHHVDTEPKRAAS
ncbi:MAG: hypothetical protein ABI687_01655 [Flavitalea sp.]